MADFCEQSLEAKKVKFKSTSAIQGYIYSHYLFSAGVGRRETSNYGADFAKFILDNKLGAIAEAPVRENEAFHPGRDGQAWIWSPDPAAVRAWWEAWKTKNFIPDPIPIPVPTLVPEQLKVPEGANAQAAGQNNAVNVPIGQNVVVNKDFADYQRLAYQVYFKQNG